MHRETKKSRVVLIAPELETFIKEKEKLGNRRTVALRDAIAALEQTEWELVVAIPNEGRANYLPSLIAQLRHHNLDRFVPSPTAEATFPAFIRGDGAVEDADMVVVLGYRTFVIYERVITQAPDERITALLAGHEGFPIGTPTPTTSRTDRSRPTT